MTGRRISIRRTSPRGPTIAQRAVPAPQAVRLQEPRQPEVVVAVQVGDQDQVEVDQPQAGAQQLALGALAAVDQPALAAARHERRRGAARRRRHGGGRPDEGDVQVHRAILAAVPGAAAVEDAAVRGELQAGVLKVELALDAVHHVVGDGALVAQGHEHAALGGDRLAGGPLVAL